MIYSETVQIPDKIVYDNVKLKVTEISANACKNNKNISKVIVGANVKKIKKNAFLGCTQLKKLEIKSKKINSIGKNAFSGISKKAVISVPVSKEKKYQKWFDMK